jgi:hypothetical protein
MLARWEKRNVRRRAIIACVVACLLMLQGLALAGWSLGRLNPPSSVGASVGASIATLLCNAKDGGETPVHHSRDHSNCCVLCEASRGPLKPIHFVVTAARAFACFEPRTFVAVSYYRLDIRSGGAEGHLRACSARAPPFFS